MRRHRRGPGDARISTLDRFLLQVPSELINDSLSARVLAIKRDA